MNKALVWITILVINIGVYGTVRTHSGIVVRPAGCCINFTTTTTWLYLTLYYVNATSVFVWCSLYAGCCAACISSLRRYTILNTISICICTTYTLYLDFNIYVAVLHRPLTRVIAIPVDSGRFYIISRIGLGTFTFSIYAYTTIFYMCCLIIWADIYTVYI